MIELERHIEILLLGNDCVIVPGLGGFVAHHVNARFDSNDNMFLPPLRTLGFNQQLKMNDSLLAQSYVEAYDISYPTAIQRIENDVKTMLKCIEEKGHYELNGIGTLKINNEGNIEFVPCEAGILTPEFYGLSGFSITQKQNSLQEENEKTSNNTRGIIYIDSSSDKKHKTVNIRLSAIRNVAVAAAIIVFSFIITSPISHNSKGVITEKAESGILRDVLSSTETLKKTYTPSKKVAKPTPKAVVSSPKANTENINKPTPVQNTQSIKDATKTDATHWSIVLCSQVQLDNAKNFTAQLKKEGFESTIIEGNNGNVKVVYGYYPTEADAYSALNKMQGNAHFNQGWVTKIDKNK